MQSQAFLFPLGPTFLSLGVGTTILVLFALCFWVMWWTDREPGVQWLAVALWMASVVYVGDALGRLGPPKPYMGPAWAASTFAASNVVMAVGLWMYLDPARWHRHAGFWLAIAPMVFLLVALPLGVRIPRQAGQWFWAWPHTVMAWALVRHRRLEPGAGYPLLAASLLIVPAGLVLLLLFAKDVALLRQISVISRLMVAMMMLLVFIHRRRSRLEAELVRRRQAEEALRQTNADLERAVAARTAGLEQVALALQGFNRSVSHDLRGPLGGIAGLSRIASAALAKGDRPRAVRQAGLIEKEAVKAMSLVSSLLDLAHVADAPVRKVEVDLQTLVRGVVSDLRFRAGDVVLAPVHVADLPKVVSDPTLLTIVFTNLLGNAFKFLRDTPEPRIEVGCTHHGAGLVLFVRDNGPGFDAAAAPSLFEPFQRLHGGSFAGHGVGLSIVRRAVEHQGGELWVEAEKGRGACFFFSLPDATRVAAEPAAAPAASASAREVAVEMAR